MSDDWTPREKQLMAWVKREVAASLDRNISQPLILILLDQADKLEREAAEAERKELGRAPSDDRPLTDAERDDWILNHKRKGPDSAAAELANALRLSDGSGFGQSVARLHHEAADALDRLEADKAELVAALQRYHGTIDVLMTRLINADPDFKPTKSGIWPDVEHGAAALSKLTEAANG